MNFMSKIGKTPKEEMTTYTLRLSCQEKAEWEAAATKYVAKTGKLISLAEWVRACCNGTIDGTWEE